MILDTFWIGYVWLGWLVLMSFLVGSMIGSFLNVCIARLPRGKSLLFPGSQLRGLWQGHPAAGQHSAAQLLAARRPLPRLRRQLLPALFLGRASPGSRLCRCFRVRHRLQRQPDQFLWAPAASAI